MTLTTPQLTDRLLRAKAIADRLDELWQTLPMSVAVARTAGEFEITTADVRAAVRMLEAALTIALETRS